MEAFNCCQVAGRQFSGLWLVKGPQKQRLKSGKNRHGELTGDLGSISSRPAASEESTFPLVGQGQHREPNIEQARKEDDRMLSTV